MYELTLVKLNENANEIMKPLFFDMIVLHNGTSSHTGKENSTLSPIINYGN